MVKKPEIKGVDDFIKGSTVETPNESKEMSSFFAKKNKKFPLDISPDLDEIINNAIKASPYKITKHDWIITAILEKSKRS